MNRTIILQQPKKAAALNIRTITMTALLSAMAYVLAFVEFPVPLSPSFARMDLSDFPALIGAFAFGPLSGLLIELVKNTLQLMTTSTGGIGEIANFLMGASYVVAAGAIYKRHKTKKTAWIACVTASFVMGIAAALANYFILLPLFEAFNAVGSTHRLFRHVPALHPHKTGHCAVQCLSLQSSERACHRRRDNADVQAACADSERSLTV